jgi:predicted PurR-regulated permease PerM
MIDEEKPVSPRWSTTTKLIAGLTIAAVSIALFVQFRNIIGPLIAAMVLSYLVYPVALQLYRRVHLPWGLSVVLIFVLIIAVILGLATWSGIALVDQVSSLIAFLQRAITNLPALIEDMANHPRQIGPFILDFSQLDLAEVTNQALGVAQTLLARLGTLVTNFASGAASLIGWLLFTLLVSYFILSETRGKTNELIEIKIPGYQADMDRMGWELGRIWNAFLRGQLIIISMTILIYTILLGILGVRYFFGLALLAGAARFVPYVGPFVAWTTYGLVSYFQGSTIFGLSPVAYSIVVVGIAWMTDSIIDNLVSPRIMSNALRVHPAAVMVAALVGANLFGITGVILAAPVLASVKLMLGYVVRKLTDQDPWEGIRLVTPQPIRSPLLEWLRSNGWRFPQAAWQSFLRWRERLLAQQKTNKPSETKENP